MNESIHRVREPIMAIVERLEQERREETQLDA